MLVVLVAVFPLSLVSGVCCTPRCRLLSTLFFLLTSLFLPLLLVVLGLVLVSGVEVSAGFVCLSLEEDMIGLMEMRQRVFGRILSRMKKCVQATCFV
ncbi:hypothetical protein ACJW30_10G039700 [Castanea mollissima]